MDTTNATTERDFLIEGREPGDLSPLEERLVAVMQSVYDPELPLPIWDLGLIYGWTIAPADGGADVTVRMTLTAPNCPAAETLPAEVEQGVSATEGVARAKVEIVFTPTFSLEMLTDEARLTLGLA